MVWTPSENVATNHGIRYRLVSRTLILPLPLDTLFNFILCVSPFYIIWLWANAIFYFVAKGLCAYCVRSPLVVLCFKPGKEDVICVRLFGGEAQGWQGSAWQIGGILLQTTWLLYFILILSIWLLKIYSFSWTCRVYGIVGNDLIHPFSRLYNVLWIE